MSGPAKVPAVIADYYTSTSSPARVDLAGGWLATAAHHPIIVEVFYPGRGWKRPGYNKRVSRSWCRKLRAEGATHVAVGIPTSSGRDRRPVRVADFKIAEVLR